MKNKIFVILIMLSHCVHGQEIDTFKIILNAKLKVVNTHNMMFEISEWEEIINSNCSYKFIKSSGFENIIFFSISISDSSDKLSRILNPIRTNSYSYIFGYNKITKEIYCLKGFIDNDFNKLLSFLVVVEDFNEKIKHNKLSDVYQVDGLDFYCLYNWQIKKRKEKYRLYKNFNCMYPPTFDNGISW